MLTDPIQEAVLELGVAVEGLHTSHSAAETEPLLEGVEVTAQELKEINEARALVKYEDRVTALGTLETLRQAQVLEEEKELARASNKQARRQR